MKRTFFLFCVVALSATFLFTCSHRIAGPETSKDENPLRPLPQEPLGIDMKLADLPEPPTPERVRLGRWLFYDTRLSADNTISCATCHIPEHAFSEPTPVSTGIRGQKGTRKSPSFVNQAWTLYPHFFWDGRVKSLEEQALGPIENPIEMGNTHEAMLKTVSGIAGYKKYFQEAFGSEEIDLARIARAIADYERTRMSGNSAYDKYIDGDESALSKDASAGVELFFGEAECNQCHLGQNFTDSLFHNLGVGWNPKKKEFSDIGRFTVTKKEEDKGAFKTPGLREITKHAPYMHDGSMATLEETVEHYNKGGNPNPYLSPKINKLGLSTKEVRQLVTFMEALDGEGYMDTAPKTFPQ